MTENILESEEVNTGTNEVIAYCSYAAISCSCREDEVNQDYWTCGLDMAAGARIKDLLGLSGS